MNKVNTAIIVLMLILVGCATNPTSVAPEQLMALSSEKAVLVGTFSRQLKSSTYNGGFSFRYRQIKGGHSGMIHRKPDSSGFVIKFDDDFETDESSGAIFAIELPLGAYEFYSWALVHLVTWAVSQVKSKKNFRFHFI